MKHTKRILILSLAIALLFAAAGCAQQKPVAKVGDQVITYEKYYDLLNTYASYYSATPENLDIALGTENANSFRTMVVDELINEKVMLLHAKELGLDVLTDEELAGVEENVASFFSSLHESFVQEVTDEAEEGVDIEEEASRREEEYLKEWGYSEDYVRQYHTDSVILDKVYQEIIGDIQVTEEEIRAYYDENEKAQRELAASDPETAFDNYINMENEAILYIPEGLKYVKHILIKIPDDTFQYINSLTGDEYQKAYEEALEGIREKAETVLGLAQGGMDFDLLIDKYGEDPGMESEPYKSEGYEVYPGAAFDANFLEASLKLKNVGDCSDLVASTYGYHIIRCESLGESGTVPFEEARDTVEQVVYQKKTVDVWQDTLDAWKKELKIIYYDENYLTAENEG